MTVVCLGETMALIAPDPPRPLAAAATLTLGHAGAESNVAVALAALGTPVEWCSRLGDDPLGRRVLAEVSAAGVGTGLVRLTAAPTGVLIKDPRPEGTGVLYYRTGSAASAIDESDVERALAGHPRLLHLSGITPALSASCARAVEHAFERAGAGGVPVSLDVNLRPRLWPDPATAAAVLHRMAQRADLVLVGLDEAQALWGCPTADAVRERLDAPSTLVVKDASREAVAFTGDARVAVPALPVEVLEAVGAGDAFAAGYLHAHLAGRLPETALRLGHLVAAESLRSVTDQAAHLDAVALTAAAEASAPWPVPLPSEPS